MKVKALYAILAALALLPALAQAQASDKKRQAMVKQMQERFAAADKNGDGQLTRAEAQAGKPLVAKRFDEIDAGAKGYVTAVDLRTHFGQKMQACAAAGK